MKNLPGLCTYSWLNSLRELIYKQLPQDKSDKIDQDILDKVESMDLSVKPSMDFDYIGSKISA